MTDSTSDRSFVPKGWHTATPRVVVQGAEQFIEFLAQVFGATGKFQEARPSEIWIGDSVVMISEVGIRNATPAFLYVYVGNADAVYELALVAGVRTIEPPIDTPYGDRRCMVEDRWGNVWQIAAHGKGRSAV
jgi:PhnB protein